MTEAGKEVVPVRTYFGHRTNKLNHKTLVLNVKANVTLIILSKCVYINWVYLFTNYAPVCHGMLPISFRPVSIIFKRGGLLKQTKGVG